MPETRIVHVQWELVLDEVAERQRQQAESDGVDLPEEWTVEGEEEGRSRGYSSGHDMQVLLGDRSSVLLAFSHGGKRADE